MNWNETGRTWKYARALAGVTLGLVLGTSAWAQTQAADAKPAEPKVVAEVYQTFYLTNLTQLTELQDVQTDLRNMLSPHAKVYGIPSQNALSIKGSAEDIALAEKMIAELDKPRKVYRLTYTVTEKDNGKATGSRSLTLVAVSGEKTVLKQGDRVPIVTGSYEGGTSGPNTQVQYMDVGLSIEATVEGFGGGVRLRTKVEQSSVAEEKPGSGPHDPVIQQTTLEGTSTLAPGKPLLLGSLDVPGSTRRQEIEVVAEVVK